MMNLNINDLLVRLTFIYDIMAQKTEWVCHDWRLNPPITVRLELDGLS